MKSSTRATRPELTSALLSLFLLVAPAVQAAPFAYITNSRSDTVSIIDAANDTVAATVSVGQRPGGVAVNPAGSRVYVANSGSHTVSVIDTASNTVIATLLVGSTPVGVAVNPAGTRVYVTNLLGNSVSVIDTASNKVIATVSVGWDPFGVAVNPAGTRVYVTLGQSQSVVVIDTASNTVTATVPAGGGKGVAVNRAGTRVYAVNAISQRVVVIDTASNTITATVPAGKDPYGVAITPDGTRVYVTNINSNDVSVIDTASNTVTATVPVGIDSNGVAVGFPYGVAVTPDGSRVYVTNLNSDNVAVIAAACGAVAATVAVGKSPMGLGVFIRPGATPPPVVGPNLRITGIEVTQAIQDLAQSVPLISGRRTFVRVHVKSDDVAVPGVTATLSGAGFYSTIGGPVTVPLGTVNPANAVGPRITVRPDPKRANVDDSFVFELPWNWTMYASLRLHALLTTAPGTPGKSCGSDVVASPSHYLQPASHLKIAFVRMGYRGVTMTNLGTSVQATLDEQQRSESWIRRIYPLSELRPAPDFPLYDSGLGSRVERTDDKCLKMAEEERNFCAQVYIASGLAALQASTGFMGDADVAYGLIPQLPPPATPELTFTRGACCTNRAGAGPSNVTDYAAHEVGHFLGRHHPVEGAVYCKHSASDPAYPYYQSYIAPQISSSATGLAGFDGGDPGLSAPLRALMPWDVFDTMGYCKPSWISDYTYKALYAALSALHPSTGGQILSLSPVVAGGPGAVAPQPGDWLMAFGSIGPDPASAALTHLRRVGAVAAIPPRVAGTHAIRLIGAGEAILAEYPFEPETVAPGAGAAAVAGTTRSFGHVVPFVAGTQHVRIVDLAAGGTMIAGHAVSAHPPSIGSVVAQTATSPATGVVNLSWTASDADGDPLAFDVFLVRDGSNGKLSVQPLGTNLTAASAAIDSGSFGGGLVRFRVVATDGVLSAVAESAPLTLAEKPPRPSIVSPRDGATAYVGQTVNLDGRAIDPQLADGATSDVTLQWSLPGRTLGSGPRLAVSDLALGVNTVTLTATNGHGLSGSTSVRVTVKPVVDSPGPTLTAGPTSIGLQVAAGDTQPRTADLHIGNSGSGNLQFTASSSDSWLVPSATTATAPATLTLTADPSGMTAGTTRAATVLITATDLPAQTIVIPVTLAAGNTFTASRPVVTLDIDASLSLTRYDALTDCLIVLRYLFGLTGSSMINGALGATATRTDPGEIKRHLDGIRAALDIDGNGTTDALTDGLLMLRHRFGLRGAALIAGAIGTGAARTSSQQIEAYLQSLAP